MSKRIFDELIKKDPTKYPARMGKVWSKEEEQELLQEIQKKVPIVMIAELHERTQGAITSHLRQIAANYYFNNKLSLEIIQKHTGLSIDEISDAISRRQFRETQRQERRTNPAKVPIQNPPVIKQDEALSDTKEIIGLLKDIKGLLGTFLQRIHYEE